MKRTLLFLSALLLLLQFNSQAATGSMPQTLTWNPTTIITNSYSTVTDRQMVIMVQSNRLAIPTPIYARMCQENIYSNGTIRIIDVVIRFYDDEYNTIPAYVFGLTVNYRVMGLDGYNYYDYNTSATANGEYIVLESGMENDFNDGTTQRWRDIHLLPGAYIEQSL